MRAWLKLLIAWLIAAGALCYPVWAAAGKPATKKDEEKKSEEKKAEGKKPTVNKLLHYRFDENGGHKAFDLTNKHLHAELFYARYVKDAQRRICVQFDGQKTCGIIPHNDNLGVSQFTFAVWVNPETLKDGVAILAKRSKGDGFVFGLDKDGHVYFEPKAGKSVKSAGQVEVKRWNHVGVVFDGKKAFFYLDGSPAGEAECESDIPVNDGEVTIGIADASKAFDQAAPRYHGLISELRLLGQPVSAANIAALYQMTETVKPYKILLVKCHGTVGIPEPEQEKKEEKKDEKKGRSDQAAEGSGDSMCIPAELVEQAIAKAKAIKADLLLLDIDSPGGRIDHIEKMIKYFQDLDGIGTASYITGEKYMGAFSAAAVLSFCTHRIIMRDSVSVGAATAVSSGILGAMKVMPKFMAAWRAKVEAACDTGGRDRCLGSAMVEENYQIIYARIHGNPRFLTPMELNTARNKYGDKLELMRDILKPGQILAISGRDARECGMIFATAATLKDALARLGQEDAEIVEFIEAEQIVAEFKKKDEEQKGKMRELRNIVNGLQMTLQSLEEKRPDRGDRWIGEINERTGEFKDGGKKWKKLCEEFEKEVKDVKEKVEKIIKAKDEHPEWNLADALNMSAIEQVLKRCNDFLKNLEKAKKSKKYMPLQ